MITFLAFGFLIMAIVNIRKYNLSLLLVLSSKIILWGTKVHISRRFGIRKYFIEFLLKILKINKDELLEDDLKNDYENFNNFREIFTRKIDVNFLFYFLETSQTYS